MSLKRHNPANDQTSIPPNFMRLTRIQPIPPSTHPPKVEKSVELSVRRSVKSQASDVINGVRDATSLTVTASWGCRTGSTSTSCLSQSLSLAVVVSYCIGLPGRWQRPSGFQEPKVIHNSRLSCVFARHFKGLGPPSPSRYYLRASLG